MTRSAAARSTSARASIASRRVSGSGPALDARSQDVGVARVPGLALAHLRPAPLVHLHEAALLQPPERLPHDAPAAAEPLIERLDVREPRPLGVRRADDGVAELAHHLVVAAPHWSVIESPARFTVNERAAPPLRHVAGPDPHPRRSPRVRGEMIDVVVCDGHPLFLDGLVRVIRQDRDLRLVAETGDGRKALAAIRAHRPHVALVTEELGDLSVPRLLGALRRDGVPTRVVLFHADPRAVAWDALGHGAAGVLSRRASPDAVRSAVRAVVRGGAALCPEAQAALAAEIRLRRPHDGPGAQPARAGGAEADRSRPQRAGDRAAPPGRDDDRAHARPAAAREARCLRPRPARVSRDAPEPAGLAAT